MKGFVIPQFYESMNINTLINRKFKSIKTICIPNWPYILQINSIGNNILNVWRLDYFRTICQFTGFYFYLLIRVISYIDRILLNNICPLFPWCIVIWYNISVTNINSIFTFYWNSLFLWKRFKFDGSDGSSIPAVENRMCRSLLIFDISRTLLL